MFGKDRPVVISNYFNVVSRVQVVNVNRKKNKIKMGFPSNLMFYSDRTKCPINVQHTKQQPAGLLTSKLENTTVIISV